MHGTAVRGRRAERDALFDHLADKKVTGAVPLSADSHRSGARTIDRPDGHTL